MAWCSIRWPLLEAGCRFGIWRGRESRSRKWFEWRRETSHWRRVGDTTTGTPSHHPGWAPRTQSPWSPSSPSTSSTPWVSAEQKVRNRLRSSSLSWIHTVWLIWDNVKIRCVPKKSQNMYRVTKQLVQNLPLTLMWCDSWILVKATSMSMGGFGQAAWSPCIECPLILHWFQLEPLRATKYTKKNLSKFFLEIF